MVCRGRLQHSHEARSYRKHTTEEIIKLIQPFKNAILSYSKDDKINITLQFFSDKWFIKSGSIRKKDMANCEKLVIDSAFEAFRSINEELDDSQIFNMNLQKCIGPEEGTTILIMKL